MNSFYFAATIEELEKIRLDNNGCICDDTVKMFSETVLQQKKVLDTSKKIIKEFENKSKNNLEKVMSHQKPIFATDNPPLSENNKKK